MVDQILKGKMISQNSILHELDSPWSLFHFHRHLHLIKIISRPIIGLQKLKNQTPLLLSKNRKLIPNPELTSKKSNSE